MPLPSNLYTVARVIDSAYRDSGYVGEGAVPSSEQVARAWVCIQDMINLWVTQGLKLWLTSDVPVPLTDGQATYALGPGGAVDMVRPLQVIEGYFEDEHHIRRPLIPLAWDDWVRLSQVFQKGPVNSYFVDKQQYLFNVSFWLVPDAFAAKGLAHLIVRNQVKNPVNLTDDMGFPIEWYMALRWGLADELATGQPARIVQRCQQKAMVYRQALDDWDVEDAPTQFVPDARMGYCGQEFS